MNSITIPLLENDFFLKNIQKPQFNDRKITQLLRLSANQYEPFMYRDKSGKFHNGIEYKLLETVAKKENLALNFQQNNQNVHLLSSPFLK